MEKMVKHNISMLEGSSDMKRQASMFFAAAFSYYATLQIFDKCNGLTTLLSK
jgi:hypothetical protein